jgi:hypothetical protein
VRSAVDDQYTARLDRSVPEDIRFEAIDACTVLPGVDRKPSFAAGVGEELFAIPSPLGGHLWQQQATVRSALHDQTMPPNDDRVGLAGVNLFERSEHRDLDMEIREFGGTYRFEPRIVMSRTGSTSRDFLGQGVLAAERSKTPAKPACPLQGDERAGGERKVCRRRRCRHLSRHLRDDGRARDFDEGEPLRVSEHR